MALTIEELFDSSKSRYRLKSVAGSTGFKNFVSWIQFTEDIKTVGFLKGSELIITTGLNSSGKTWIYEFISELIRQNSAGLIINTGNYIRESDITKEVIDLCNDNDFPLFIMPWEIRLSDIMQDYCNRVLIHSREQDDRTRLVNLILHEPKRISEDMSELQQAGFLKYTGYQVMMFKLSGISYEYDHLKKYRFKIEGILSHICNEYHVFEENDKIIVLVLNNNNSVVKRIAEVVHENEIKLMIFCGDWVNEINKAYLSYNQAEISCMYGVYEKKNVVFFEDIGVYRILSMVKETYILKSIAEETLGKLMEYDKKKSGSLIETLEYYLKYDGSVRMVAEKLYAHRNTINYRIKKIREILGKDLEHMEVRFQIQMAFYIMRYMDMSENDKR